MKVPINSTTPAVTRTLRILVADDDELVRRGLRTLLETQSGWTICGEATTGTEAIEKVRQLQPDIIVLDIHMPGIDGLQVTREILAAKLKTRILILTVDETSEVVRAASEVGAHGVVMKSDAARNLIAAVSALSRHEPFFTPKASGIMSGIPARPLGSPPAEPAAHDGELTDRERDVVILLATGHTGKETATMLNISTKTVETHRTNVMRKLGLQTKAELVRYAIRTGLVRA